MADRATLVLRNTADREKAIRWSSNVPFGTRLEFKAPRRSLDQNALMWLKLTAIAKQFQWYGEWLSAHDWKDIFSASLRKARVVPGIDGTGFVVLGLRTSDMSKEEFGMLIDLIDAFAAEKGIDLEKVDT